MKFKNVIDYKELEAKSDEIHMNILYTWDEYNPGICDPKDEIKLKDLSSELLKKLKEASDIMDQMDNIRIDSYGC